MLKIEFNLEESDPARALHVQVFLARRHSGLVVLHRFGVLLTLARDIAEHAMRFGKIIPDLFFGKNIHYRRQQ